MKIIHTRYSPHKRARIRAFFAEGIDKLHLPLAVEALPALLHLSLFLFFAGLAVFLFNINHTVFNVAVSWIGLCTGVYTSITFMPMFWHDSPYYAPLSSSAWYLYTGIRFTLLGILQWITSPCNLTHSIHERARNSQQTYRKRTLRGMEKGFEEIALLAPSRIDGSALMWTCESLDEDQELEQFFAGIPGFCNSKVVDNSPSSLDSLNTPMLTWALCGFLERTFSSNLVSEEIKIRRFVICIRAIDAARLSDAANEIFSRVFQARPALLRSEELAQALMSIDDDNDWKTTLFARGIVACIMGTTEINYAVFRPLVSYLGIPWNVFSDDAEIYPANLIRFTRQFVHNFRDSNWKTFPISYILQQLRSRCNVRYAQPHVKRDFCCLWNEIVRQRRDSGHSLLLDILEGIQPLHVALHEDPIPYDLDRLCGDSASNFNETAETARTSIATSPALHHRDSTPSSIVPPVTEYDPPPPTANLDHATPHPVDEESRDGVLDNDNISPVASSIHLTPLENDGISDGITADPIKVTADPSAISSMVNTDSRSASSRGTASRPTRNMTTATPSFVPDTMPSRIPLLTILGPAASLISVEPNVNQSGRLPDDGSISLSSSQNFTPFPLPPQAPSGFHSNAATEIGPLDSPDGTPDPNLHVMSQSFTPPSPGVDEYSLRPGVGDPSETSGSSHEQISVGNDLDDTVSLLLIFFSVETEHCRRPIAIWAEDEGTLRMPSLGVFETDVVRTVNLYEYLLSLN